jgi:hypothetical protein
LCNFFLNLVAPSSPSRPADQRAINETSANIARMLARLSSRLGLLQRLLGVLKSDDAAFLEADEEDEVVFNLISKIKLFMIFCILFLDFYFILLIFNNFSVFFFYFFNTKIGY